MSIVGGFLYPSPSANAVPGNIVNISAFKISGLGSAAALAVCLYVWNPTNNEWEPMLQPATT